MLEREHLIIMKSCDFINHISQIHLITTVFQLVRYLFPLNKMLSSNFVNETNPWLEEFYSLANQLVYIFGRTRDIFFRSERPVSEF